MGSGPIRVLVATLGSHGDLHPFVAIGRTLRERGHEVRLIAPAMYESLAKAAGLEFVGVGTIEQFERFASRPELWNPRTAFHVVAEGVGELLGPYYRAIVGNYEAGRTVLVLSSLMAAGRVAQDVLGAPAVSIHLSPVIFRSSEKPARISPLPIAEWMPKSWNRMVYAVLDRLVIDRALGRPVNALRKSVGLGPVKNIFDDWVHSPDRAIGMFPEWFARPAGDWPKQTLLTGFPLYDEADIFPMDAKLERFLDEGGAPIVFTPGSAMRHGRRFFDASIEACRLLGRRGLLLSMHGGHVPRDLPAEILHVRYAPFSRLLGRCAAIVHHGGIGTSAQALATGTPQLVMPMAHDQADNAERLKRLGVAEILPALGFTARRAAWGLERAMDPIHRGACLVVKNRFAGENPLVKTAELIEETFERHVATV